MNGPRIKLPRGNTAAMGEWVLGTLKSFPSNRVNGVKSVTQSLGQETRVSQEGLS